MNAGVMKVNAIKYLGIYNTKHTKQHPQDLFKKGDQSSYLTMKKLKEFEPMNEKFRCSKPA